MSKDPIIESHIAQSRAKIERTAPDTVAAEHRIDRTQQALARSGKLLERLREPLLIARRLGGIASRAVGSGAILERHGRPKANPKPTPKRPR